MDITPFLDQLDESLKDKVLQLQKGRLVCDAPCRRLWGSQDLVVPQCSPACCSRIQQSPAGSDLGAAALCASVLGGQKGFGLLCCLQWGCECMLCLFHVSPRSQPCSWMQPWNPRHLRKALSAALAFQALAAVTELTARGF